MNRIVSPVAAWDGLFERLGSIRPAAVLRIVLGPVTVLHLWPFLQDARAGIHYNDHFWEPYVPGAPRLPGEVWVVLLWAGTAAAVLMALGVLTRLTTTVTFAVVAGNLLASQTHFRHNRTFLAILLLGLALLPTGRVLSLDALGRRLRGLPARSELALIWPLVLLRVQVSLVYLASGISKLVDPDWLGGVVLWDRVVRYRHNLEPWPLPDWGVDFLTWRPLYYVVAPVAIGTELFLGVGLWATRTRLAALWVAVFFHLSIEISAKIEVFSVAAIAALAIWVTPSSRDRVVHLAPGRGTTALRALDWFGRFRLVAAPPDGPLRVVDRDGTELAGRDALLLVLTRLPATFMFAAPVLAVRGLRGRGRTGGAELVGVA